ncbi:MAG TPA: hypothetical protein VN840_11860 [Streptosporangiaceae bacterium]|nr:hypothetical protein [Streptosporangiaceae bacterium]
MIAVCRYQAALLLRSHRWIPPAVLYVLAVAGLGGGSPPLGDGLRWSALMLVPAVAWLTRSMLTAEPGAARACVAAAAGPRRTQVAALLAALAIGAGYALVGVAYEVVTSVKPMNPHGSVRLAATVSVLAGGLVATLICLLVGSAVGAFCNPPLIRRPAAAMLSTTGAVVLALASNVSPANAAARTVGSAPQASSWLPGLPVIAAVALLVVAWTASALAAGHRSG